MLLNHQIINSPPWVLVTLPLSLPGSVWVWSRYFSRFQTNSISVLPTESNAGEMFITFPRKKEGQKYNQTCANHFLYDRGEGILCCGVRAVCCVLKLDPHKTLTPGTTTRLSFRTLDLSPLLKCLVYTFLVAFVRAE